MTYPEQVKCVKDSGLTLLRIRLKLMTVAKMKLSKPLLVTLASCFVMANIADATDPYQTEAAFISSLVQVEIAPTVPKQLCEKLITNTKVREPFISHKTVHITFVQRLNQPYSYSFFITRIP